MNTPDANLDRANRVLRMLSRINRAIVRAEYPDNLYAEACRIAVECGLFSFAWIGLADSVSGQIRLVASDGGPEDFPQQLLAPDGMASRVRSSGEACIYNDLRSLPAPLQPGASLPGACGVAVLPLHEDGNAIGVFFLATDQPECFDQTVIDLLTEVASDIEFALAHMLTEQRRLAAEAKLHYLEFYDVQTGLPNRARLEERLPALAARAGQRGSLLTLLDIRLQRLDRVSQGMGGVAVDEMLRTLAARLEHCRGNEGLLAQLAQNEFVMVSLDVTGIEQIDALVERVQQAFSEPIPIGDKEVFVHAAIGGVVYPLHEHETTYLVRRARAAAERSSREGGFRLYSPELEQGLELRLEMEGELHRALERGEFQLYYQPQLNMKTGIVVGVEALLRWQHPQRGLVSPAEFIPLLEECGLMPAVGDWVLQTACKQAKAWQRQGLPPLRMAVNLSAQQFRLVDLVDAVRQALHDAELDAEHLELELTESLILENAEQTIHTMHELKKLGVSLSLDDFGTGYSSLSYLRRYPIDRIKIDQSFIREMTEHIGSAALVRSILAMASNLGLTTIAEGVETRGQFGYLRRQLCQEMQGYLFSRPLPISEMTRMLQNGCKLDAGEDVREAGRTLLAVDDEPHVLAALKRACRRENWQMLTASNAREALELLAQHEVGVIISDQRMPGTSGTELLHRVKDMYPETMRILLTGHTDFATIVEAVNRGDLYKVLGKPIDDDFLRDTILEAFAQHDTHAEQRRLLRRMQALEDLHRQGGGNGSGHQ
jgi:EAL domain-containing protein (putative c-di-GMP-specific phosphodiesterase class I)/GGDEF domain-containing protein/FixJ family two-component response regulator